MLVTDAHESSSFRSGRSRETLRFFFHVSHPKSECRVFFSILPDGLIAAFNGWSLLACLYCVGVMTACTGVLLGTFIARLLFHRRMVLMLFHRSSLFIHWVRRL
jgi:hypothetical protein